MKLTKFLVSVILLSVAAAAALVGCSKDQPPPDPDPQTLQLTRDAAGVPESGQKLFATPEEAAGVLKDAVLAKDRRELVAIFGDEGRQLLLTGDRVEEDRDMTSFGRLMNEYLRVDRSDQAKAVLYLGKENWPFPIPVVQTAGLWFFDTVAGKEELLNRRIGENELSAIKVCRAFVTAEAEYASKDRTGDGITQYAQHFMSRDGRKNGLYWPASNGEAMSPMGPLVAAAHDEGYGGEEKPHPYHGYLFRIINAQGEAAPGGRMSYLVDGHMTRGFAVVATPTSWGASGIMTFIVNQEGKVYQKNLGESSRELARAMTEYNPDDTWEEVKE